MEATHRHLAFEALRAQERLLAFAESDLGLWYHDSFVARNSGDFTMSERAAFLAPGALRKRDANRLRAAETFAVTPEMHALAVHFQQTHLPPIGPEAIQWPIGFLALPEPLVLVSAKAPLSHLLWSVEQGGIVVTGYGEPDASVRALGVQRCLFGLSTIGFGALAEMTGDLATVAVREHVDLHHYSSGVRIGRYLLAFLLLAGQKLAAQERAHAPASLRPRLAKARLVPRLTVFSLRRERLAAHGITHESGREFSHRWIVRAHWRRQPHGPGRSEWRWVLIQAHVKGPDDKPLVVKDRAWVLER